MNSSEQVVADSPGGAGQAARIGDRHVASQAPARATEMHVALEIYRGELRRWIERQACGDTSLFLAARALCEASIDCGMLPEQVLIALHPDGVVPPRSSCRPAYDPGRETRYRRAIHLLLRTYFGLESRERDPRS